MNAELREQIRQARDQQARDRLFTIDASGRTIHKHKGQPRPKSPRAFFDGINHGTHYAYSHHGCHCERCTIAELESRQREKLRARRTRRAKHDAYDRDGKSQ